MKKFALIVALLSFVLLCHAQSNVTALVRPLFQTDGNVGGHKLTNVLDVTDTNGVSLLGGGPGGGITEAQADLRYDPINSALAVQTALNTVSNQFTNVLSANIANITSVSNQWLNGSNNFNTSINLRLTTNDTRNVSLNGSFLGTLTMSNSTLLSGTANPFRIGFNSGIGPYVDGTTAGQEVLVNMISPWENAWNFNNGYPFLSFYSGVHGDYTFRFYKLITGKPTLNPDPTKFAYDGLNYGNIGAPQTVYAPYYGGSSASMVDLPSHDGQAFRTAMPRPWLGASTDDPTHTESDSNPGPQQTNFLYLTNMSYYFETSGITAALNAYGTAPNIWGDCGWEQTNRTTDGVIQENKALFPFGLSNEVAIVHSHGTTITLHIYHTANQPNQFPNIAAATPDTAWRTSLGGHFKNSYPSGTGADAGYQTNFTYPAIDAFSSKIDTLWYYTNGIDGLDDADIDSGEAESQAYEHYRLVKDADAILYPQTKNSGRVYWRNWTWPDGSGNNGAISAGVFTNTTALRHQLWLGIFANHASSETPYYANFIATDQGLGQVGTDPGLSSAMSYAQTYENMGATNWAPGTFGLFSLSKGGAFDGNFTAANYTNGYSVIGEFNGCGTSGWYTNSWNTNQNLVVTNSNFLSVWTDTTGGWPKCVFCDPFVYSGGVAYTGTNSLWIRQLKDGYAVLAGNLGVVSSNYNSSLVIGGGIASNQVYFATNIFSQTPFGTGLLTNNFIGTIGAASVAWVKLTPALPQTRVLAWSGVTVGDTNRPDGGHDYGINVTAGGTGNFNGPASSVSGNFVSFSDITGKNGADSGKSASSFDAAGAANTVQSFATSYSNSVNIASGNSAEVSTNRFAPIANPTFTGTATGTFAGNGASLSNTVSYTHEGTSTNLTITFNGTRQMFTMTNGPTQFYHFAGANGSACIQIPTNITLHFDYTLTGWLGGTSNIMVTNGDLVITSFGGTNDAQLQEAIVEK